MNKLEISMYETRFPKRNTDYFDSLREEEKQEYLSLYIKYSMLLYPFMISKLELDKIDNLFVTSKNKFKKIEEDDMDLYQLLSKDYLKYLYIRNNIYIERLNKEEIEYLKNKSFESNYYDLEAEKFIDNTYEKVILENVKRGAKVNLNYGPDASQFYKPDNIVLIGYRYDDFYIETTKEKWEIDYKNRQKEILFIEMIFKRYTTNKLNCPVLLQKYDEFSIIHKE